jgi:hypothetical protein
MLGELRDEEREQGRQTGRRARLAQPLEQSAAAAGQSISAHERILGTTPPRLFRGRALGRILWPSRPFSDPKEGGMKIDKTEFGSITVAGKTYQHDVVIRLSDRVVKRKKKLSKRLYGTSHTISEDEARFVFEKGCKELILGTGQYGNAALSPEAAAYLKKKGCKVVAKPTPKAIKIYNLTRKPKVGLFHVTC